MKEVESCQNIHGKNFIRFNEDTGQVIITFRLESLMNVNLAESLELKIDEPVSVVLDYSSM